MISIVSGEHVARFISEGMGEAFCPPYAAIGIERDGKLTAGILLNCFEGADVHLTAYGKGWTRGFCEAIGVYVYHVMDCERITILTESEQVVRLAYRLGGKKEGVLRSHYGNGRDAFIVGILREEWRFMPKDLKIPE